MRRKSNFKPFRFFHLRLVPYYQVKNIKLKRRRNLYPKDMTNIKELAKKKTFYVVAAFIFLIFCLVVYVAEFCTASQTCSTLIPTPVQQYLANFVIFLERVLVSFVFFILFKLLEISIKKAFYSKEPTDPLERTEFTRNKKLFAIGYWTFFTFVLLNTLIDDFKEVFFSVGLVGIGLTFALQQPLLNLVGWMTITFKGIFRHSDRIEINPPRAPAIRGDVIEIGIMNTTLEGLVGDSETKSHKTIIFPNQLVLFSEVRNYSHDTNYILNEITLRITFESNLKKTMDLFNDCIVTVIKKNRKTYLKRTVRKKEELSDLLRKLLLQSKSIKDKGAKEELQKQADKVQHDLHKLEERERSLEELEDELKPKIRVETEPSGVLLIGQYLTPYVSVKKNRTDIYIAILAEIQEHKDIHIAYPHIDIVPEKKAKK